MDGEEKTHGAYEGTETMYVKLISYGHEFIVKREHALTSGTIKAMLRDEVKTILPRAKKVPAI
uniref:Elongin-C n=1 Tax=Panthera tigris altaica TaxID=74533 RepID=A0A8C9M100_PANTA